MSDLNAVMGWDVFEQTTPPLEGGKTRSPQEQLLEGIIKKDPEQVQAALVSGANPKVLVGKEKMSVFAVRHFSLDVVKVLQKKGVSFKDIRGLLEAVFQEDLPEAFEWVWNQKSDAAAPDCIQRICETGAYKIFNAKKDSWGNEVVCFIEQSPSRGRNILSKSLAEGHEQTLDWLFKHISASSMSHMFKSFWNQDKCSASQIKNLGLLLKRVEHSAVVIKNSMGHKNFYISKYANGFLTVPAFQKMFPKIQGHTEYRLDNISSVLEMLLYNNNPLCIEGFAQKSGAENFRALLNRHKEHFVIFFALDATREIRQGVLKATHQAWKDWRDDNGCNVLHYLASRTSIPKTLCDDLYALDAELLLTADFQGKTPLMFFSAEQAAGISKKMMKKELRSTGTSMSSAAPVKRKM